MSIIFLVTPVVIGGWPILSAAACAAAATMGFNVLQGVQQEQCENNVELTVENSEIITERMRADEDLILAKGDIRIRIYKDARGQCAMHVMGGNGKSTQELRQEGTELINRIKQQYAYQRITQELKQKGFSIAQEAITDEGKIKISLRRFE